MKGSNDKKVTFSISRENHKTLRKIAIDKDLTLPELLREMTEKALNRKPKSNDTQTDDQVL